jgi:hypothetical protein
MDAQIELAGRLGRAATCVYVVGMHRSGTSAAAELLARLGLGTPPSDDLIPATRSNQHGHWESKRLVAFNHRLLAHLGGNWTAPVELTPGWQADRTLDSLRAEASALFAATFASRPVAWKDPRLCIVLPFWQTVVDQPVGAVFVYRDPLEVASSLETRDGLRRTHAVALWERYVRAACSNLEGIPTLAADYDRLLDDPAIWCEELVEFLSALGISVSPGHDATHVSLDSELRHHHATSTGLGSLSESAQGVMDVLRSLQGTHQPWRAPEFEPEPAWVSEVLGMRLELETHRRAHRAFETSRAHRLVSWIHRHGSS